MNFCRANCQSLLAWPPMGVYVNLFVERFIRRQQRVSIKLDGATQQAVIASSILVAFPQRATPSRFWWSDGRKCVTKAELDERSFIRLSKSTIEINVSFCRVLFFFLKMLKVLPKQTNNSTAVTLLAVLHILPVSTC